MSDRELILAAAHLSHRAPEEWVAFLKAFTAYTDDKRDDVVAANADSLVVTQGRAQACVALRNLFAACRETASKIETRSQKPSQPRQPLY